MRTKRLTDVKLRICRLDLSVLHLRNALIEALDVLKINQHLCQFNDEKTVPLTTLWSRKISSQKFSWGARILRMLVEPRFTKEVPQHGYAKSIGSFAGVGGLRWRHTLNKGAKPINCKAFGDVHLGLVSLCSYSAALNEIGNADRHEVGGRLNNRAENSHQPFRRRERAMQRFRSIKTLQKFSSVHSQVHNHFNPERHLVTRHIYKQRRTAALAEWRALAA